MGVWADVPFPLVQLHELKCQDTNVLFMAKEMANAHNNMIRSLNSLYNQAPYVKKPNDVADLLSYSSFWLGWLDHHHHVEETQLFPDVERVSGEHGLMSRNVEQHHGFHPGVEAFKKYIESCRQKEQPEPYDAAKYGEIIDSFGPALAEHLSDEIDTLLGLEKSSDTKALKEVFVAFDERMREGDKSVLFPIVLGSSDAQFHDSEPLWPPVPAPVRYLVRYVFMRKHQGVWRFSPSDLWGRRRELTFGPEK